MRSLFFALYALMAFWLMASSVLRVLLSLSHGVALDLLPAFTGGIGLAGVIVLLLHARRNRRSRGPGESAPQAPSADSES